MNPIILGVIVAILAYVLPRLLKFYKQQKYVWELGSKIPGPPTVPILGNAAGVPAQTADWTPYFAKLTNEFYPRGESLISFWMAHVLKVIPLDGKTVKDILDSPAEITKGNDYDIVLPWLGTGLLISTNEKWRSRRKMLTPTFHFNMLEGYVGTFNRQSAIFTQLLEKKGGTNEFVDLFPYVKRCALDIICETAMGFDLNSQTNQNTPYAVAVGEMGYLVTIYSLKPWLWLSPVWYGLGYGAKYNKVLKTLTDFTKQVIADRKEKFLAGEIDQTEGRKAFLDMLLEMRDSNSLSDEDIREEVDTFMFEGHDTTSSGIAWTLWCLATHPDIQTRLHEELYALYGDSDRDMKTSDFAELPYLDRVVKESMRINPPVPFVSRELKNELQIGNHLCPKGAQVLIAPLMIHRNEKLYPNPEKFDPDRFLPENAKQRHAYDYIPFSAGPRNCIGQKFATYEEKIMVSWIIRKYKITANRTFDDNGRCPEVVLRPDHGIPVRLERR